MKTKTKTQEQLEKEIEKLRGKERTLVFIQYDIDGKLMKMENWHFLLDGEYYCNFMGLIEEKLTQHLTDIKNFEKLIGESKRCPNCPREIKCIQEKEIKEALKEL